ncbi:hypothetical protein [Actinophytocola sp.]|uniref:hypothetical protein n=1 Tax=Actinophytocola sp. TaxID=1872138 RepID=UPI003D6BA573
MPVTRTLAGRVAPDALRTTEADLVALRTLNQRLLVENSKLLDTNANTSRTR